MPTRALPLGRTLALAVSSLALLAAAADGAPPPSGSWSGRPVSRSGYGAGPLPVSFTVSHGRVMNLTLGPARIACGPRNTSATSSFITMPKLHGFPTERLEQHAGFVYDFESHDGSRFKFTRSVFVPEGTVFVGIDGFFKGRTFAGYGPSTIDVHLGADADGTIDPASPIECVGEWKGVVARPR